MADVTLLAETTAVLRVIHWTPVIGEGWGLPKKGCAIDVADIDIFMVMVGSMSDRFNNGIWMG